MAYKFQDRAAILSGSLTQEGDLLVEGGKLDVIGATTLNSTIHLSGATDVTMGATDSMTFIDAGGVLRKDLASDVRNLFFSAVSGDATVAAGGALTIANDAVESGMLNDNVISGQTELAHADILDADELMISDGGVLKRVGVDSLRDHFFGVVSGDATVADGGALTIAAGAVENSMLADDAVGADELAANAVVNASIASNAAIDMDKLDGGSLASSLTDLAQTDLLYAGDADASNALKSITFSNFEDAIFGNVSGDATIAAGGALTISAGSVETAMVADDAITGAKIALFDDSLAATDTHFLIADGSDYSSFALSGDVTCTNAGVVTIGNDAVEQAMIADDAVGADQLAANAVVNASVVDGALKADKLDIDGSTDIGADLVDGDLFLVDDGAAGANRKSTLTRLKKYIFSAVSGDASASDAGAFTIGSLGEVASVADGGTLAAGTNYFADITDNAAVTMPNSPSVGDTLTVKAGNIAATKAITINKGAADHRMDGLEALILESPFAAVTLVYVVNNHWKIV